MTPLPVIDFSGFRSSLPQQAAPLTPSDPSARQAVADQIADACLTVGFFYLVGHGIAADLRDAAFAASAQFFQLPGEAKQALSWASADSNLGYVGLGRESLNPGQGADWKEAFNIGSELNLANPNRWPADLPGFRETMLAFYQSANGLAAEVLQALALALQLPADFFVKHHQLPVHTLRLLHYPPLAQDLAAGCVRAGEHSDYGSITLLFQDCQSGLQVKTSAGEWIEAPPYPEAVLVNLGDLMQRWTNDRFRSTPHRVVMPAAGQSSRYSMALFCDPDPQTLVMALPGAESARRYPPITAGEYLKSRLQATY
jgi:isopenicillin N synthase-like dioxygenase